jgi:acetyl-CoA C-acetyltransferase
MTSVFVLGGYQSDFARKATGLYDLVAEAAPAALAASGVPATDVDVVHVSTMAAELFTGQGQLGGFVTTAVPELAGRPASRHEAACASGGTAVLGAMADIEAGRYDVALVLGVELMRNVSAQQAAANLAAASWVGREAVDAVFPWPALFNDVATAYADRWGLEHTHLGRIAEINYTNARRNPLAQTRDWSYGPDSFYEDDTANPPVDGRLRKMDCGRITDGAAAIVVAGPRYAQQWATRHGRDLDDVPVITGWGHRTGPMLLADKIAAAAPDSYLFPHLHDTVTDAYQRAGLGGPEDVDVAEVHDCFSITEYTILDHIGLTAPGQSWQAVEKGVIEPDGSLPVNPSGGLLGLGHPVGATGVRLVLDATRQVTGDAGHCQVAGARTALTVNVGGSCTTVVSFVIART